MAPAPWLEPNDPARTRRRRTGDVGSNVGRPSEARRPVDTGCHPGVAAQLGAHRRQRKALIVATGVYHDPKLEDLSGPTEDAKALTSVLRSQGRFEEVDVLRDQTQGELRQRIFEFFRGADADDLLLLYISCHGIRDADADGTLYFATSDTRLDAIPATALECAYVNKRIDQCRSNRVILFVDCCSAGAIHGPGSRGPELLTFQPEDLPGRGRVVITAATALQQAVDVADGSGSGPSVFASALVQGIETGEADHDRDGKITVIEAFHYVESHMRERGARQTPARHAEGAERELALAWLPLPAPPKPLTSVRKPRWYTHATFYELLVRGFYDSNGDGVGDLRGVLVKADYLEWLGVQAVVLL